MELPKLPKFRRAKNLSKAGSEASPTEPSASGSQVTDQTLEQQRKEIFSRARRFIYPVHITKRHIVRNSLVVVIGLFLISSVALYLSVYRYHKESGLIYRITSIVPLPAAKVNGRYVRYYDYLFHLRISTTFLKNDAELSGTDKGSSSLDELRRMALFKAKQDKLVELLAKQNQVEVEDDEVEAQLAFLVTVSSGKSRLNDIVKHDYGVEVPELKRSIYIQLLKRKLAPILSVSARERVKEVTGRAKNGEDFAALAREFSEDDQTAQSGGTLGVITTANTELDPLLVQAALDLPVGSVSDVIETSEGFHVVKKLSQTQENAAEIAHILIRFEDIDVLLQTELEKAKVVDYIKL